MPQSLSFPKLGIEIIIDRVAFRLPKFLGSLPIYWYGVIIATGFLLAILYVQANSKKFGLDADRVFNVILISIIVGVIGARLFFVIFTWENFKNNLGDIIRVRDGGLAIYGGIIGGVIAGVVTSKIYKVKTLPLLDLAAGGLFIGQAIGRWGNFTNIEAFGGNTNMPWGMTSSTIANYLSSQQAQLEAIGMKIDPTMPVHPTFLYESLWCIIGFFIILFLTKRRRFDGQLSLAYLGWYGLGRFFIEGLRTDSLMLGGVRISQLVALLCFVAAIIISVGISSRIRREGDDEYLKLYVNTVDGQLIVEGNFYPDKKKGSSSKKSGNKKSSSNSVLEDIKENSEEEATALVEEELEDMEEEENGSEDN